VTQGTGAHILVVDDEPALVRAVETNLRKHDFRVERAAPDKRQSKPMRGSVQIWSCWIWACQTSTVCR
jgi:DNA-binding NtrC family response regulator